MATKQQSEKDQQQVKEEDQQPIPPIQPDPGPGPNPAQSLPDQPPASSEGAEKEFKPATPVATVGY